jgi:hypothetical protein
MGDTGLDLAHYIDAQTALVQATDLFVGALPPKPETAAALLEYPGAPPIETMGADSKPAVIMPRVQVLARGAAGETSYPLARGLAYTIWNALVLVTNEDIGAVPTYYLRTAVLQTPGLLYRDDNDRAVFSFNVDVWRVAE